MGDYKNYLFWAVVLVSCVCLTIGVSYNIEILHGVENSNVQSFYNVASSKSYYFIFTFVIPMLVFPLFAGFLIDLSLGLRWSICLFYGTLVIGQLIWLSAGLFDSRSYDIALIGYLIMGCGTGCMIVAQYTVCAVWFSGRWLTTVFSLIVVTRHVVCVFLFFFFSSTTWSASLFDLGGVNVAILCGTIFLFSSSIFVFSIFFGLYYKPRKQSHPRDTIIPTKYQVAVALLTAAYIVAFTIGVFCWVHYILAEVLGPEDDKSTENGFIAYGIFTAVCFCVFSVFVDKTGYILIWMASGCTVVLLSLLFYYWVDFLPSAVPLFFLALGTSVAVVPGISIMPYILKRKMWGRGFALTFCSTILGHLFTGSLSLVLDEEKLDTLSFISVGAIFIATILICILNAVDYRYGRILNKSHHFWEDLMWNQKL